MICEGCIYCDLHGIPFCKLMWKTNLKNVVSCEKREGTHVQRRAAPLTKGDLRK